MKRGFTLIELIFVIVIIGLLASVAVPKFLNLKQNAIGSDFLAAVTDLNGSGGSSTYLNATELNGIAPNDVNITNLYKFQGKNWTFSSNNKIAYYRYNVNPADIRGYLYYRGNGKVQIYVRCYDDAIGNYLTKHGLKCDNSNRYYYIDLNHNN